ncbi:MAG: EAL domain-containing protein [Chloroflexi bacterium]|nr:EAL domain-containing protein [Chloroflexota bacterium]
MEMARATIARSKLLAAGARPFVRSPRWLLATLGGSLLMGVLAAASASTLVARSFETAPLPWPSTTLMNALIVLALVAALLAGAAGVLLVVRARTARVEHANRELADRAEALRQNEERYRSLVLHTSDVIVVVDDAGMVEYQSPSTERVWGYAFTTLRGTSVFALVHPDDAQIATNLFRQVLESPRLGMAAELRLQLADNAWYYFEVIATNLLKDPKLHGIVMTFRDISERKEVEQLLSYQAFHDSLTDLPNRALFIDRLEHALARASRRGESVAVLFVDLDHFKLVNDSLGHSTGDRLLVAVADRIRACLRREDTAARLGGDEFAILLEDVDGLDRSVQLADRIQQQLTRPFSLGEHEFFVSASVGVVLSDASYDRAGDLLRDADLAMYRAKANGRGRHEVFDHSMNARIAERLTLETSLRRAIERNELRVHYQPIVALEDGAISGFEALLRWEHPQRGLIPPGEFIPLAEETGLILPIGRWVLEESCRQVTEWQARFGERPLTLAVNISARQLQDPGLVDTVAAILRDTGFPPANLKLEITESIMIQDVDRTIEKLRQLDALAIDIALDDFGTGYSSLSYLRRLPVAVLKLDRSFVSRLGQDRKDEAIIRAVVTLSRDLGLQVVGEGVETSEQMRELWKLGCHYAQGYFFSKPLPGKAAEELVVKAAGSAFSLIDARRIA